MRILCVCLGNICRSPAAEAILQELIKRSNLQGVSVDSCGLGTWHIGRPPDPRMVQAAMRRGWQVGGRAKGPPGRLFEEYDIILSADRAVMRELTTWASDEAQESKIQLLGDFSATNPGCDIPDPFHREEKAFEEALDLIEDACQGFISSLQRRDQEQKRGTP